MLDEDAVRGLVGDMWRLKQHERPALDEIYEYMLGRRGLPRVPDGAEREIEDLAKLSLKNVLPLVRDAFAQNLSVVGYRSALARENDAGWRTWQANRMDARQCEVYRPAITYGASYVVVSKDEEKGSLWRPRSPRQLLAVYEDPQSDEWPQYAFEMFIDNSDAKSRRRAVLYDDTHMYPIDLGDVQHQVAGMDPNSIDFQRTMGAAVVGDPVAHGAEYCPVIRFSNGRDADDVIVGEIAPLLVLQRALNSTNFDAGVVSRFGAFPQRVITGWSSTSSDVMEASARRVWAFDDPEVKTSSLAAADLSQYEVRLTLMLEFIATVAQVSPSKLNPKLSHVSADALAAAEANEQRKTQGKRDLFGEAWEQVFRCSAQISGDADGSADESAEVVWRDTEVRSFAAVVDGISKLAGVGVPLEELVDLIPGATQQKIKAFKDGIRRNKVNSLVDAMRPVQAGSGQQSAPETGLAGSAVTQ